MAQSGAGTIHTGASVARRAAFHEQRLAEAAERAANDAGYEALLQDEARAGDVRLVPAEKVEVTRMKPYARMAMLYRRYGG
jgi:hypothetical protein